MPYYHLVSNEADITQTNIMTAQSILSELDLTIGTASKSKVLAAARASDEEGTIQAHKMVKLMGASDPTRHTTCSLKQALIWLGCKEAQ